jgi:hypothetical protein
MLCPRDSLIYATRLTYLAAGRSVVPIAPGFLAVCTRIYDASGGETLVPQGKLRLMLFSDGPVFGLRLRASWTLELGAVGSSGGSAISMCAPPLPRCGAGSPTM